MVGYSTPIKTKLPLETLKAHLFTLPEEPDAIPYATSYYEETCGGDPAG